METQELGAGVASGGNIKRRDKHVEINTALNDLENELRKIRGFIGLLSEGPIPSGASIEREKEPEPSFLHVYNNIAERVMVAAKEIETVTREFREIVF